MKHAIIMAGGKGRRLWPVSRKTLPKQFVDFFGTGRSLLQMTYDRLLKVMPKENIIVVTHTSFDAIAREQLPDLPLENFVFEPINRNTAPATLMGLKSPVIDQDGEVIVIPADQMIMDEARFDEAIEKGAEFVSQHDFVLTIGATPTRPEPGYGYIQTGEAFSDTTFKVKSFTEKPDREFAKMFIESGEFLWNTGIYMSKAGYLKEQLTALVGTKGDYSQSPNLSVDMAILEKMEQRAVMQCTFGWADIGAWHGIYESLSTDEDDNVLVNSRSNVVSEKSAHNVVALPDGKLGVLSGLDGYIVAEKDNVLFICKKEDSSALVRKMLGRIENEEGMEDFV